MKQWLFLIIAVSFETAATSLLNASEQFKRPIPTISSLVCYGLSFYFLSLTLKTLPVGIVYGLWCGIGIVLVTLIGIVAFKQIPDLPAIIGLVLIMAGVFVINVYSKMQK